MVEIDSHHGQFKKFIMSIKVILSRDVHPSILHLPLYTALRKFLVLSEWDHATPPLYMCFSRSDVKKGLAGMANQLGTGEQ